MKKIWTFALMFFVVGCQPARDDAESDAPPSAVELAHPELLVETDWLAQQGASIRIVDARSAEDYSDGHIPGAVSIPRPATFDPNGERGKPEETGPDWTNQN